MGPTRINPVLDPLVVLHLHNPLFLMPPPTTLSRHISKPVITLHWPSEQNVALHEVVNADAQVVYFYVLEL